jgi:2-dehydro-3-deoxygalactonokinase
VTTGRPFIALDTGTTRTRAWLVADGRVIDEARADTGVRDTARDGSPARLFDALAAVLTTLDAGDAPVLSAGMIGSSLGLGHVPHVPAPAALEQLAAGIAARPLPSLTSRVVHVVPGVRTSPLADDDIDAGLGDVMRGEETTALGALWSGVLSPGDTMFSVGSHWKRVVTDSGGRIAASVTSLGGEIVETVRTATILAEAVPAGWPASLEDDQIEDGISRVRRSGLPRALFEVRLGQLARQGTPLDRLARLAGIVIGADLAHWPAQPEGRLVVIGAPPLADAWCGVLRRRGFEARRVPLDAAEAAFRQGLAAIGGRAGLI